MFPGFEDHAADVDDVRIAYSTGGKGPPLLLLHGYPQTRWMWRHVAPVLADRYTVIAPDLRGYGDSATPPGGVDSIGYAKRTMADELHALMGVLGHRRFAVAGHDRGARVTHRMCLDHPDAVAAAAVIDIVPTLTLFEATDRAFASAYYHWFFLSQPADLPERLIGAAAEYFLHTTLDRWSAPEFTFDPESLAHYTAAFDAATIHASCEDYRAAAGIDLVHDAADRDLTIGCPLLVMWGERGAMHRLHDVPATWRDKADHVVARSCDCGHFVPEECPDETATALLAFLEDAGW